MEDTITLFKERGVDAFNQLISVKEKLVERFSPENAQAGQERAYQKISFFLNHEVESLTLTFGLSLNSRESLGRFLSNGTGALQYRENILRNLTEQYPDSVTIKDLKPLFDRLEVIRRLATYAFKRLGGTDEELGLPPSSIAR